MQLLNVSNLPIYLPYDIANLPFGDPLGGVTCTSAAPGVITAPGYVPKLNDVVSLSYTAGGSIPTGLTVGQAYFVVSPSTNTFSVSLTKGGAAITTSSTGANLILHMLSAQPDGSTCPFETGGSVIVVNQTGGTLVLQGAPDANPTAGYPTGPGSYVTLVSVPANSMAPAVLSQDWIRVSTAATLGLLQN